MLKRFGGGIKKKKNELLELVKTMLVIDEHCRDDDMQLISKIWLRECPDLITLTGMELLNKIYDSEVSSPESIRRRRQLLQSKYPELRGTKYQERQVYSKKYKEHVIKGEIHELA